MFGKPTTINIENIEINVLPPPFPPAVEEMLGEINRKVDQLMSTNEDLAREVQETKDAVIALTGRYQTKIDEMQTLIDQLNEALEAGDTPAAREAVTALDNLQTEMAELGTTPPAPEPEE